MTAEHVDEHVHLDGDPPCHGCGWHVQPEPLERGRYAVFETPDGGWAIARSRPLCETCTACGCGEQADPVMVPAMVVAMVTGAGNGKIPGPVRALLGKVARNG